MKYIFWCSAAFVAYTYVGYPIFIWVRSRLSPRQWTRDNIQPSISIIVAVHDGVEMISEQLSRLLAIDYPAERKEIIVVSDGSTDGTAEFVGALVDPRVRTFVME